MDLGKEFMEYYQQKNSQSANRPRNLLLACGLATLAGLALLLVWGSHEAAAYSVGLDPAEIVLDVSPNGTASAVLRVIIDNSDDVCAVTVEIQTTVGGSVSTDPSATSVTVGGGQATQIPVNISTESGAAPAQREGTVRTELRDRCGVPPPDSAPRTTGFRVIILQFAMVEMSSRLLETSLTEGDTTTLSFSVANLGNGRDSFNLSLRGLPGGWTADYPANLSDVEPGANNSVEVEVALKAGSAATANLRLVAISGLNSSVMAGAEVAIEAESSLGWLKTYGVVVAGGGALAIGAAATVLVLRRRRAESAEW